LARNLEKPVMSLYGTEWREHGFLLCYSIMMEKFAQAVRVGGGGCTPTPFHYSISTIMYKVAVYAPAENADTLHPYVICALYHVRGMKISAIALLVLLTNELV
jgi:hypothetical protein